MKTAALVILLLPILANAQAVTGKWKTIDDDSGEAKSVVEIFERDGRVFGKIVRLFRDPSEDPDPVCTACAEDDDRYNRKIIGMEIIRNMKKNGNEYADGEILDPNNGRIYRCRLWVEGGNLMVRGYWGPFYRTQTWIKLD